MAFTERGVAMLSSVLRSKRAIHVNIQIMRVFTRLRQAILDNADLRKEFENIGLAQTALAKQIGVKSVQNIYS